MEIDPTVAASLMRRAAGQVQPAPSSADIEAFTKALFGDAEGLPEDIATNTLQKGARKIDASLASVRDADLAMQGPDAMLRAQSSLLRSVIEVDVIAKTAGAISQGINKLSNLQ